jgi:hypothetical protein
MAARAKPKRKDARTPSAVPVDVGDDEIFGVGYIPSRGSPRSPRFDGDDARAFIAQGLHAASKIHEANPSEHSVQVLMTLGFMQGIIHAQQAELARRI